MRTLRAHFDGKVLVPEGPVDLPLGRSLKFGLLDEEPELAEPALTRGSPAAIRAAVKESPHFTETEIAALNEAIESETPRTLRRHLRRVMRQWSTFSTRTPSAI